MSASVCKLTTKKKYIRNDCARVVQNNNIILHLNKPLDIYSHMLYTNQFHTLPSSNLLQTCSQSIGPIRAEGLYHDKNTNLLIIMTLSLVAPGHESPATVKLTLVEATAAYAGEVFRARLSLPLQGREATAVIRYLWYQL